MVVVGDIYANSPIFAGLIGSLVTYVAGSLLSKPTPEPIMAEWIVGSPPSGTTSHRPTRPALLPDPQSNWCEGASR
jgi:SSS family solute:Na+ symporter